MVAVRRDASRWGAYAALGIGTVALLSTVWWYSSPQEPNIPRQERSQGPEADYQPGGSNCKPWKLYGLNGLKALTERDRCAAAYEEHRIEQDNLNQQIRSVDLAEGNLRLSVRQARSGFVQTVATVAAFLAAAIAAYFAKRAADHTKRGADIAEKGLLANERAWLSVELIRTGDFIFSRGGNADIEVVLLIKNIGKTPALNVHTTVRLMCDGNETIKEIEEFSDYCRRVDRRFSRLLLPQQSYERPWVPGLEPSEMPESSKTSGTILPVVVGCVTYQTLPDHSLHQTVICYNLSAAGEGGEFAGLIQRGQMVPKERVHATVTTGGHAD
jgi:archaellum component FlaG (FlaF/FlaG flagellin family)